MPGTLNLSAHQRHGVRLLQPGRPAEFGDLEAQTPLSCQRCGLTVHTGQVQPPPQFSSLHTPPPCTYFKEDYSTRRGKYKPPKAGVPKAVQSCGG